MPHTPRIAIFPGQFDPVTKGHLDVIHRTRGLFDQLVVAVGVNPDKRELFTLYERVDMLRIAIGKMDGIRVEKYSCLTVDFARQVQANVIIRGLRDVSDLRHEFQLAMANQAVGGIETVFVMTGQQYALTSSSLIRQVLSLHGDVRKLSSLLPTVAIERLVEREHQLHDNKV